MNIAIVLILANLSGDSIPESKPQSAQAKQYRDAIIGLKWGWTPKQVEENGAKISFNSCTGNLCSYTLVDPAKSLSWVEKYALVFGDDQLIRVIMPSKLLKDDPGGAESRRIFDFADSVISAKHAKYLSFMKTGERAFKRPEDFYKCLAFPGCGQWQNYYKGDGRQIGLEIRPYNKGMDNGGWVITTVEADPECEEFFRAQRAKSKKSDIESF